MIGRVKKGLVLMEVFPEDRLPLNCLIPGQLAGLQLLAMTEDRAPTGCENLHVMVGGQGKQALAVGPDHE